MTEAFAGRSVQKSVRPIAGDEIFAFVREETARIKNLRRNLWKNPQKELLGVEESEISGEISTTPTRTIFEREKPKFSAKDELTWLAQIQLGRGKGRRVPADLNFAKVTSPSILSFYLSDERTMSIARELNSPIFPYAELVERPGSREFHAACRMMEILAFDIKQNDLRKNGEEGEVLLDTDLTLDFYKSLHPESYINIEEFGLGGIDGVSVPDFLSVNEGKIQSVIEVTASKKQWYFDKKYKSFDLSRRKNPDVFRNTNLTFIVSARFPREIKERIAEMPYADIMETENLNIDDLSLLLQILKKVDSKTPV